MSANIKVVFIVVIGVCACLLSIFSGQHFYKKDHNNHLVLFRIEKVAMGSEHIRLLERSFIQDADQATRDQISLTMESVRRNLQAAPHTDERWRQEIESLNRYLDDYGDILRQLYEPAFNLKAKKMTLQEIGLAFSREVEEEIIKPYRKEGGLRIYAGESIDPFKARAKDAAYDLVALHLKQQLILLELLLNSDLEAYKQKKKYLSTALARHKAQLRYMAVLMESGPSIQSVLDSLDQKLEKLLNHEHAVIELFTALAELDDRLKAAGNKLVAAVSQLSSKITSDTLRTNRLNRIFNWGLLLGILGGLSVLGTLLARNIIQFVEDQKTAKQIIEASEEKYRSFIENAPVAMYTLNVKGEFTYGNRKLFEITGYKTEDWLSKPFHPIVHPEDLDFVIKRIQNRLEGKGAAKPYEIRIFHSSGEIMWVKINSESIYDTDNKGKKELTGMQSFVEDISDRKLAEEALRESEEKYRLLVENLPSVVFKGYKDWSIEFFDDKIELLTGYKIDEFNSKSIKWLDIIFKEDVETARKNFIQALKTDKSYIREYRIRSKAEDIIWIQERGHIVCNENGDIDHVSGVFFDITQTKKLETQLQQSQKMESIGTLAGGIAHDFNNILAAVIGYTEIALDDVKEDKALYQNLQQVLKAGERARDLVKQILTFSRQTNQELKPVQVQTVAREALNLLRASLPTTIEIKHDIQNKSTVLADPTQIHQVLMNICTNASHAMQEKDGTLEIRLNNVELDSGFTTNNPDMKSGPYLKLTISDTGHGMPSEVLERIFDPFYTTKEKGEGTGMGLAVVHGIIKSHGGTITVDSRPEKGSTFNVYLPVIERDLPPEIRTERLLPTGTERILFVDDEQTIVNSGSRILESLGYEVVTMTSSIKALELFKAQADGFDLVITDMTMPQMTGDNLAKELMSIRPDIPVILCTGFSARIDKIKAMSLGIRAFVSKPILKHELAEVVRAILDG